MSNDTHYFNLVKMEIIEYIIRPELKQIRKPTLLNFVVLAFCYIIVLIPLSIVEYLISIKFNISHHLIENKTVGLILFGVFIAPVYEEIIFRLLLKLDKKNIGVFTVTILTLIFLSFFKNKLIYLFFLSVLLITIFSFFFFFKRKCKSFVNDNHKYFYWGSSILFGILHAANFSGNIYLIISLSLFLGSPQIVLGFILGYIRMNYGFLYGILFHIIINSSLLFYLF